MLASSNNALMQFNKAFELRFHSSEEGYSLPACVRRRFKKAFDLRFDSSEEESSFKRSLELPLLKAILVGVAVIFLVKITVFCQFYAQESRRARNPLSLQPSDARFIYFIFSIIIMAMHSTMWILALLRLRLKCFLAFDWELIWVVYASTVLSLRIATTNRWNVVELQGMRAEDIWMDDVRSSELQTVLGMDAWITVIALIFPIRVHSLIIIAGSSWVTFEAVIIAVGSPFPETKVGTGSTLLALFVFAVVGLHKKEKNMRDNWRIAKKLLENQGHFLQQEAEIADQMGPLPNFDDAPQVGRKSVEKHSRRSNGTTRKSPIYDGSWTLVEATKALHAWLHVFHIQGSKVTLQDGRVRKLARVPGGASSLEGGVLELKGHLLCRTGKAGGCTKYKRFVPKASASNATDGDDIESTCSSRSSASFYSEEDIACISDLDASLMALEEGLETKLEHDLVETVIDFAGVASRHEHPSAVNGDSCAKENCIYPWQNSIP